jgi:hypothetical protein
VGRGRAGRPTAAGRPAQRGARAAADGGRGEGALRACYEFTGDPDRSAAGLLATRGAIRSGIAAYRDLGADEVVLYCWATDPDQVDRIADLVG